MIGECPDCHGPLSSHADSCPTCGYRVKRIRREARRRILEAQGDRHEILAWVFAFAGLFLCGGFSLAAIYYGKPGGGALAWDLRLRCLDSGFHRGSYPLTVACALTIHRPRSVKTRLG